LNTYEGLHARFYDVVYAGKPYAEEARFVADELAREGVRGGQLLDVACGSGRHAGEFGKLGFEVTGLDYSPDLLMLAREREGIEVVEQDMRELDLGDARFDAVTCLFDSIGYPQSNDGVVAALAGMRRHLADGGAAAIEFLHTPPMLATSSPVRVRRFETPGGGTLLRISETEIDALANVMHVAYDIVLLEADGTFQRAAERQSNRFFGVEEMRALIGVAGFGEVRFVPAYEPGGEIGGETFHVLAVARP
jgi:ubiquinone/menaquinone biosynthesis C-methylase UbiE